MPAAAMSRGLLAVKVASLHHIGSISSARVANGLSCLQSIAHPRRVVVWCTLPDKFDVVEQRQVPLTPFELQLPFQTQEAQAESAGPGTEITATIPAEAIAANAYSEKPPTIGAGVAGEVASGSEHVAKALNDAVKVLEGMTIGEIAFYSGVAAAGLFMMTSFMSSLELFPLFPEAMQTIGLGYSVLIASCILQGKPISSTSSPFKAINELLYKGNSTVQTTGFSLQQDLVGQLQTAIKKLVGDWDGAVNHMEDKGRAGVDYARVLAEKEALEAVTIQLAAERDQAMSEIMALKNAVDAITERMFTVEKILTQEVQQLKQNNHALETVSLQLASERDTALKELAELKKVVALDKLAKEEQDTLRVLASKLVKERDEAFVEIEELKMVITNLQAASASASGLTPEQELFIKGQVRAVRSQFIDIAKPYDEQKEEVETLISHLVNEYGAPHDWTQDYVKQFLTSSSSRHKALGVQDDLPVSELKQPRKSAST